MMWGGEGGREKKGKRKKDRSRNIPPSCWPSLLPIPSLWFPMFSRIPNTILHIVVVFLNLDLLWRNFGFSLFRSHIYCFRTWRTPRLMTFFGWFQPVPQLRQSMALIHISHLMILLQHRIFPGQLEWFQPLQPFIPYSSRSWAIPCLLVLMYFGSWKGH